MCILFLYVDARSGLKDGEYKLILASNRDEYYKRPAKQAAPWEEDENVFGGRDMEPNRGDGTWLALGHHNKIIKIGALLNLLGECNAKVSLGRGPIVSDYVKGNISNFEYTENLLSHNYNAFNFVSAEINLTENTTSVLHTSNSPRGISSCELSKGLGFGNSSLSSPFQKVICGSSKFEEIIKEKRDKQWLVAKLLDLLKCKTKFYPDQELQRRSPDIAEQFSSIFVKIPEEGYGSRTRTVILIDHKNKMEYYEETMATSDPDGEWTKTEIHRQL